MEQLVHLMQTVSNNTYNGFMIRLAAPCGVTGVLYGTNDPKEVTCPECLKYLEDRR